MESPLDCAKRVTGPVNQHQQDLMAGNGRWCSGIGICAAHLLLARKDLEFVCGLATQKLLNAALPGLTDEQRLVCSKRLSAVASAIHRWRSGHDRHGLVTLVPTPNMEPYIGTVVLYVGNRFLIVLEHPPSAIASILCTGKPSPDLLFLLTCLRLVCACKNPLNRQHGTTTTAN